MGRVVIFTAEALLLFGGIGDQRVSNMQIPKDHTHASHTADESAISGALQSGRGTLTLLLRTCYQSIPSEAGKTISNHRKSKQKLLRGKAWLQSAPSCLWLPFVLVLRCLCSSRETIGSLEHK